MLLKMIVAFIKRRMRARDSLVDTVLMPTVDAGADEEYGDELRAMSRQMRRDEALARARAAIGAEFGLDPLSETGAAIIGEVLALRLSVAERLAHFSGRWEREVMPAVRRMGERFIGPLEAAQGAVTAHSFSEIDTGAFALPAGAS